MTLQESTSDRVERDKKREKAFNQKCQEAIEPILRDSGMHARIVFYPGRNDKNYRTTIWRRLIMAAGIGG